QIVDQNFHDVTEVVVFLAKLQSLSYAFFILFKFYLIPILISRLGPYFGLQLQLLIPIIAGLSFLIFPHIVIIGYFLKVGEQNFCLPIRNYCLQKILSFYHFKVKNQFNYLNLTYVIPLSYFISSMLLFSF